MRDIIRDAAIGQAIRRISNNRYFQYPEEKSGFAISSTWAKSQVKLNSPEILSQPEGSSRKNESEQEQTSNGESVVIDWYDDHDPENPQNWSNGKRAVVSFIIWLYTFIVYATASIYVNSVGGIMEEFNVGQIEATLGLSLYVLGYGIGPMLFSPLAEIEAIGRNPIYIITMIIFVIISIPTCFTPTYAGIIILRFLQGIFGSPCLATGGATIADMYSTASLPYAMLAWVSASYFAPALGPLMSGFIVPATNWRWALYESLWISALVMIIMLTFLPETNHGTILQRRAKRLSPILNTCVLTASQTRQAKRKYTAIFFEAIIKPLEISFKDPAILFVQIYTSIIYGIYYSFFEVFPLVYPVDYGMSTGELGLVFLCILVGGGLGIIIYSSILYSMGNKFTTNESRLIPALGFTLAPTVGLFLFAWTARSSIHWIVPTIGITIFAAGGFVVFQCIFIYIPLSYPQYAASLFAANGFFRSALACGSVLFAHPLFGNLGISKGVSLLGGLSVIGIIGMWLLYAYGAKLRAMSRFTVQVE